MDKYAYSDLQRYHKLKNQCDLSLKLKIYFSILQNAIDPPQTKLQKIFENKKSFSKALFHAFSNLSYSEKGCYLLYCLNFVLQQQDHLQKQKTKSDSNLPNIDQIKYIETTCQVLLSTLKINHWSTFHLKLDKANKIIFMQNKKKKISIEIKHYFVRKSKKYKAALVMEAINEDITNDAKKYIINFSNSIIQKMYQQIMKCVLACQSDILISIMQQQDQQQSKSSNSAQNDTNSKTLVILSPNNINRYLQQKQKIMKLCLTQKFQFKRIYKSQPTQLIIQHSQKYPKVYKMQNIIDNYPKNLKQDFISALYHQNQYIISTQILESFSKKYKAVYQKYLIHNKIQEMICIREQNIAVNQQEVLFMKSVQNIMNINPIEYMHVRIRNTTHHKTKIIVFLSVNNTTKKNSISQEIVKRFLIEMNQMLYRKKQAINMYKPKKILDRTKQIEQKCQVKEQVNEQQNQQFQLQQEEQDDQQYKTVKGDSQQFLQFLEGDGDQSKFYTHSNQQQIKVQQQNNLILINTNRPFQKLQQMVDIAQINDSKPKSNYYLLKKYITSPEIAVPKYKKQLMKQHYLFKQWVRGKNGGVICINQAKIAIQKNLFKFTITKYGKNLLKGQILKISLPIQIFRKQSHLESIGRNLSYAPLFLQELSNIDYQKQSIHQQISKNMLIDKIALERVKYTTLLTISVGTVGILMDKPFNPILGETIQLWIDGCPMYVQQISHHPPIGAFYFKGRGYTLNGTIQPKMNFGMNYIRGFSPRSNFVKFYKHNSDPNNIPQLESQLQMSFGKMVIKGMLFGEREFNFQDKIFVFDKTNLLFSYIHYGPRKKHIIRKSSSQMTDYVYGHIYQVNKQFLQKFQNSNPRVYPTKTDIVKELSNFEGCWNDIIKFDGIQYINFAKDLPCQVIHQKDPLPSNSSYRTDLQRLIEDNLPEAQKQKDRMQQIQRRDQKLRDQMIKL